MEILLGHVDNKIINRLYSCSDVYIMSSLYEGLPLTLLEALSSGLPCIVPNIKSVKSIINKSKSGIVVNYNNISETESKIKKFLDSDFLKLKKSSRKFAEKNLDWSIISKKYKNLFFKIYND